MGDAPERYGFESFDCAPALRLEAAEKLNELQFSVQRERLDRMQEMIERLEKRLWLAVYGVVAVILAQAFQSLLVSLP